MSKERRLVEPQIIVGLLVDRYGFPLGIHSFEGNTAETKTILPVIEVFQAQYGLNKITVVAYATMLSTKNFSASYIRVTNLRNSGQHPEQIPSLLA